MKYAIGMLVLALAIPGFNGICRAGDVICMEAESAVRLASPMEKLDATKGDSGGTNGVVKGASGNQYIEIAQGRGNPPAVTNGLAFYEFETAVEGSYILWCRVWWDDECGNSFAVSLNEAPPFAFGQDGTFKAWHWVKSPARLKQLNLGRGLQRMTILNREDGVKIDQILFTADAKFVPVGIETVSPAGGAASESAASEKR